MTGLVHRAILCATTTLMALSVIQSASASKASPRPLAAMVWTSACAPPKPATSSDVPEDVIAPFLIALIVQPLIKAAVRSLGEALIKAGEPKDIHVIGRHHTNLYKVDFEDGENYLDEIGDVRFRDQCINIIAGPRLKESIDADKQALLELPPMVWTKADLIYNRNFTNLAKKLFDWERTNSLTLQLAPSSDGTAFRFVPLHVRLGGSFRARDVSKNRELAFTISLSPPSPLPDERASAVRSFGFKKLTQTKEITGAKAKALAGSWIPLPGAPSQVDDLIKASETRRADVNGLRIVKTAGGLKDSELRKLEEQLAQLDLKLDADAGMLSSIAPYTIRVDIHEVQPGSKFLIALGKLLTENAEAASKAAGEQLDPVKRMAVEKDTKSEEDKLRIQAITESAAWAKAKASNDTTAIRIAEIKTNAACRSLQAAGYSDPVCVITP